MKTKKIVMTALLAALCCIATMIIKIPSPLKGYLNLGDCVVLLSGWLLTPFMGFLAAGLGSALADIFSGYTLYAPATFVIKGLMTLMAFYIFNSLQSKIRPLSARIISAVSAEIIMILGYYIFEGFLYGFLPSLINMPANIMQGILGLILGVFLIKKLEKHR